MAATEVRAAPVNERGGPAANNIPPWLLLALLVYSYASGVFSGPQIERTAQENLAVRVLCADTYPGRDTLRTFRRKNAAPLQDGLTIPAEARRRQERNGQRARAEREARAYARCHAGQVEHAAKLAARERERAPPGKSPAAPDPTPGTQDWHYLVK
jgi:hypothetical protein